ncbi:hypothetical protein [Mycobacterium antarcticum]|uniref:hypothetical protein n=1 Tax=Mycolicibacterium sp. TUM20983 TaxID=3023369 RepID=UPI0024E10C46|nr:hypothetical protein [Mycolicibacterium sp. TUM20983]
MSTTAGKLREWVRRYLPCEVAGTTCEMGGAAIAYGMTGSAAVAAIVATIGASIGYYAAAYVAAVRIAYRADPRPSRRSRAWTANIQALRSVTVEFGPAEVIDSLLIRPLAFYVGPLLFGGMVAGWIFAKLVADVGFYVLAVFSYERFKGLLVVGTSIEEVSRESAPSVAAA